MNEDNEIEKELKALLDDRRTGLKDSSDTNKTYNSILALFTAQREAGKKEQLAITSEWEKLAFKDIEASFIAKGRAQALKEAVEAIQQNAEISDVMLKSRVIQILQSLTDKT